MTNEDRRRTVIRFLYKDGLAVGLVYVLLLPSPIWRGSKSMR